MNAQHPILAEVQVSDALLGMAAILFLMAIIAAAGGVILFLWHKVGSRTCTERQASQLLQEELDYREPATNDSRGLDRLLKWWVAEVLGVMCLGTVFFPPFGFLIGPVALLGPFLFCWISDSSTWIVVAAAQAGLLGGLLFQYWRYRSGPLVANVVWSLWWLASGLLAVLSTA